MDIYTRVENLEKNLDALIKQINNNKFYTDADIGGVKKGNNDNYFEIQSVQEDVGNTNNVVDSVMTETIPSLMDSNEELQATIDMIMTDIIPNIIGTSTEER
jgi:protoporphyrinogen oxidase